MSKLISLSVMLAVAAAPALGQATLELRVVTDGGIGSVVVGPLEAVNVFIEGRLVGDPTDGLALWSANMQNSGSFVVDLCDREYVLYLDTPAGEMQYFKRNLGFTNPGPGGASDLTGYSGTCDGAFGLLQIGGGQNTIHNTGPTLYPVASTIALGVADAAWTVLASGVILTPPNFTYGDSIVLELNTPFAMTIDPGQIGPVYAVSEAATIIVGSLSLACCEENLAVVHEAWSWGYHGNPVNQDLGIQVFPNPDPQNYPPQPPEPRLIDANATRLYLEVIFYDNMVPGAQSVSTSPAIVGVSATGDGSPSVIVTFPSMAPLDETCYNIDMAGSTAMDGSVNGVGVDFCVCYLEADINRDGVVNPGDRNLVVFPLNLFIAADQAFDVTADVDRSGVVNIGDKNLVISALNFWHTASPCP